MSIWLITSVIALCLYVISAGINL